MKFAETVIQKNNFVYLKAEIRNALEVGAGDALEWIIENSRVVVRKKEELDKPTVKRTKSPILKQLANLKEEQPK